MALKAVFEKGGSPLSYSRLEYHVYDKNEKYFSLLPFNVNDCVDGETILEVRYSNACQVTEITNNIPDQVEGYEKSKIPTPIPTETSFFPSSKDVRVGVAVN